MNKGIITGGKRKQKGWEGRRHVKRGHSVSAVFPSQKSGQDQGQDGQVGREGLCF